MPQFLKNFKNVPQSEKVEKHWVRPCLGQKVLLISEQD